MAISLRGNNGLLSRLVDILKLQRLKYGFANREDFRAPLYSEMDFHSISCQDGASIDMSKWNKVDGRVFGIRHSMISSASWIILKILHSKGFEAYLVGGCVRDLILKRVPKDFDVITTAELKQIRKHFHRAQIVGRRFPICIVNIKGFDVEVSSFKTIAQDVEEKEIFAHSQIPKACDKKDLLRWRNSMHRDFTINSLFFDPFLNIIYDYTEGIADLRSLKLRTLIPASLSFKTDCARILRGLRIAARLGLSFSKDTETAMQKLSPSIMSLNQSRIMMELNYMLSYGAAAPSLCLLHRFNLLKILLPFHAAYLVEYQSIKKPPLNSMMLMKLFFNLDKLFSCDRPSDCNIWVGLLAFHMALVRNPQNYQIVLAFAATLYHGGWDKSVNFVRENARVQVNFVPEITRSTQFISDEELARGVAHFASIVQGSIAALTTTDCLVEAMSMFPHIPFSGLVFVSKKTAKDVADIFGVLVNNLEYYKIKRESFEIDYQMIEKGGKGMIRESRYVIGKVILETLNSVIVQEDRGVIIEKDYNSTLSDLEEGQLVVRKNEKVRKLLGCSEVKQEKDKKLKLIQKEGSHSDQMAGDGKCIDLTKRYRNVVQTNQSPYIKKINSEEKQENLVTSTNTVKEVAQPRGVNNVTTTLLEALEGNKTKMNEKTEKEGNSEKKEISSESQRHYDNTKKDRKVKGNERGVRPLSSLFR